MINEYQCLLPVLVFLILLSSVLVVGPNVYIQHRLEDVCDGSKVTISLGKQPAVFTLDGSSPTSTKCHLELVAPNQFGFYVFMDQLHISDINDPKCSKEFLQFGRDFVFISSIKSKKFCEPISRITKTVTVDEEGNKVSEIDYGTTDLRSREYLELNDNEMYIWLVARSRSQMRLIVTPVMKTCSRLNSWWTPCSGQGHRGPCVRRDLVCDGEVNCGLNSGDESPSFCRTRVQSAPPDLGHWLVPSYLGIVVSSVLLTAIILCCCKYVRKEVMKTSNSSNNDDLEYITPSAPPALGDNNEDCPPPSYSEAMLQDRTRP